MRQVVLILCIAVITTSVTASARTWNVFPGGTGDAPTIQAGLDSAAVGDTVFAHAGTYDVDIIFWPARNGIVLKGAGLESTIVRGDAWQTVLYVAGAVPIDSTSVICGLTLRRGGDAGIILYGASPLIDSCRVDSTANGPGIYAVSGTDARIRRCTLEENSGPAVRLQEADSVLIESNRIENNHAVLSYLLTPPTRRFYPGGLTVGTPVNHGGGVYCWDSRPLIRANCISGNSAQYAGGGIYCYNSRATVEGNWISGNSAQGAGGGVHCDGAGTIADNTIVGNSAGYGAGLYCFCADTTECRVSENTITDNLTGDSGGGIHCYGGGVNITGNTIARNSANIGGGIWCGSQCAADSNVIRDNIADQIGGGIYCDCPERIKDNLILLNESNFGGGIYVLRISAPFTLEGNIVAQNTATGDGGGIHAAYDSYGSFQAQANHIVRNVSYGNGGGAYLGSWGSNLTFTHNTIVENSALGLGHGVYADGLTATLSLCNIARNGWGVHNSDPVSVPSLEESWWGHASGPWHQGYNPTGAGDSLSAYAWDFQPWLTEADTMAPPFPPADVDTLVFGEDSTVVYWRTNPVSDVAGYRVYSNIRYPGIPYSDTIDVGTDTSYTFIETEYVRYVAVTCYDRAGQESWYSTDVIVLPLGTAGSPSVEDGLSPSEILIQNFPNPFDSETSVHYRVPQAGPVKLRVYDIHGRLLETLVDERKNAGAHSTIWDGTSLSPGIYFYELTWDQQSVIRKAILLR